LLVFIFCILKLLVKHLLALEERIVFLLLLLELTLHSMQMVLLLVPLPQLLVLALQEVDLFLHLIHECLQPSIASRHCIAQSSSHHDGARADSSLLLLAYEVFHILSQLVELSALALQ
jgi:hypothetical protein